MLIEDESTESPLTCPAVTRIRAVISNYYADFRRITVNRNLNGSRLPSTTVIVTSRRYLRNGRKLVRRYRFGTIPQTVNRNCQFHFETLALPFSCLVR